MTIRVKDVLVETEETPAKRLRQAREDLGLSRAELARRTDIPAKSIEKFEYGSQEPSLSRTQALARALGVTTQWIMGEATAFNSPADIVRNNDTAGNVPGLKIEPANNNDRMEQVRGMLEDLDDMRQNNFEGNQRHALAMIDTVLATLKHFDPGELLTLANERELYQGECEGAESIIDTFSDDPTEGQKVCGHIEERIVDTAILGVDIYTLDRDALVDVARDLSGSYEIEQPRFFGWGEHSDFVPLIRSPLRILAVTGKGYDFENTEQFPTRG